MRVFQCSSKREARELTIIQAFRNATGLQQIPRERQYWTLCGPLVLEGSLIAGCEYDQVLSSGVLHSPSQFHGVERKRDVHQANQALLPGPNLYLGEIHAVLEEALSRGALAPAIVNLDTFYEPRKAVALLGSVLDILNHVEGPTLVVLNTILRRKEWSRYYTFEDVVSEVNRDPFCKSQLSYGWVESGLGYEYQGKGKARVTMGTVVYYQPYREAALTA